MRIQPLIQTAVFDVADWEVDAEFGVFPQGARAKDAVFAPSQPTDSVITPDKRYLFKRSKRSYPDQFWGEVVAYRIGCLMGLEVPPTFVAWNSSTNISAALIEWFYVDGEEVSALAGDLLQKIQPDFDREKGSTHNLRQVIPILRAFVQTNLMENYWRQWWTDALLFDALIGNTDRHQDNWGLLWSSDKKPRVRMSPVFDNGTSLGYEIIEPKMDNFNTPDRMRAYIQKGKHHIRWQVNDDLNCQHVDLLRRLIKKYPELYDHIKNKLDLFELDQLRAMIELCTQYPVAVPLTQRRAEFICHLVNSRFLNINEQIKLLL